MKKPAQLPFTASDELRQAIGRLGRTEDVHFSPDNRRLAIAGMIQNRILVLDVDIDLAAQRTRVDFTDYLEVTSSSFNHPHGLFWIDEQTLIVANRDGAVPILRIPADWPASRLVDLDPQQTIGADDISLLQTPGSVSVAHIGMDLHEVLICNNFAHYVSRHILDKSANFSIVSNDVLLDTGLNVPDGVAYSRYARWIAVSSHYDHSVFLYENDTGLSHTSKPNGILRGVNYPHGVRFTADERFVLVADAGAPFVHVYVSPEGDWCGERHPADAIQVIDDDTFVRGNYNPEEGGPKGIDIDRDSAVLVATCEEEPIALFDIRERLQAASNGVGVQPAPSRQQPEAASARAALLSHLSSSQSALREARADGQFALQEARQRAEGLSREMQAMLDSRSWRATTPLRWLSTAIRQARQVMRMVRRG